MKIAVTGAFCSGKTTLANQLHECLDDVGLIRDECREVLDLFPHMDWTIPEVRDYLFVRQLLVERRSRPRDDVVVVDGGIINVLAHDRVLLRKQQDRTDLLSKLKHRRYDLVFHCSYRGIALVDDGQRFTNPELQARVDREVSNVLEMLGYTNSVPLSGDRELRFAEASKHVLRLRGR